MLKKISNLFNLKVNLFDLTISLISFFYLYLLSANLTTPMCFFFLFCLLLKLMKVKANTPLRILLIILICAHHGLFYGAKLTTESALNFILGMCGLKMLEQNSFRDRHLLLFMFFLLLNTALLFEKSLTVFIFVILSYLALLLVMSSPKWQWRYLLNALKSLLFVTPAILAAYFFFPRWNSQIFDDLSVASNSSQNHLIGLSLDLDFKNLTDLKSNPTLSFFAFIPKQDHLLYWRSHTISDTDGWNWQRSTSDTIYFKAFESAEKADLNYKIQLETPSRYFIGLDRTYQYTLQENTVKADNYSISALFPTTSTQKSYTALSNSSANLVPTELAKNDVKILLALPTNLAELQKFKFENAFDLQKQLRDHFRLMNFGYTFEPGLINNVTDFLKTKKGFCSHFASYATLLLRYNKIPARLVSGYLGGQWNPMGEFYRIEQNDAHVWVEAYLNKSWIRLDPTLWVAPYRANNASQSTYTSFLSLTILQYLTPFKFWLDKTNSDFQLWLETFNLNKQKTIASKWKLTLNEFYLLGILSLVIGIALMAAWIIYRQNTNEEYLKWRKWVKFWNGFEKNFPQLMLWGKIEAAESAMLHLNNYQSKKWLKRIKKIKKLLY